MELVDVFSSMQLNFHFDQIMGRGKITHPGSVPNLQTALEETSEVICARPTQRMRQSWKFDIMLTASQSLSEMKR